MKLSITLTCYAAVVAAALTLNAKDESLGPGHVDFGTFSPPGSGGQFVEVNIPSSVIALATCVMEKQEPEVAELLKGLQLVRVNVIGLDDENRAQLEQRVASIRKDLDGKGWERLVAVQQKGQNVGVYLKTRDKDTVEGLVVTVIEDNKQAVFINVVGNIKPSQLSLLGERLHIEELKKAGKAAANPDKAKKAGE